MSGPTVDTASRSDAQPAWDIAYLFPPQGMWTEAEYLSLNGNRIVEFSEGYVEVLPLPSTAHQFIVGFLFGALSAFATANGLGYVLFAPLRIRLREGKYREPDIVFMLRDHVSRIGEQFWDGADLAMEVVSDDDRRRDLEVKREEYAKSGISEYWIVESRAKTITVLRLDGDAYALGGEYMRGMRAQSILLPGFSLDVNEVIAASDVRRPS